MPSATRRTALLLALGAATASCGPEREFTGVWRLEACRAGTGPEGPACPADPFVYELHLGRYGDDVTGLLVQYLWRGADLGSFDKLNECGCHFLGSGRADDAVLRFELAPLLPPGCRHDGAAPDGCAAASPVIGCHNVLFDLEGGDDALEGTIRCRDGLGDESAYRVRFVPESGSPRNKCVPCESD